MTGLAGDDQRAERALALAIAAGELAGLEVAEARIRRLKSSIHVELPRAGVIARVEDRECTALAERQVQVARAWALRGAPVATLIRPELQPLVFADGAVTLWRRIEARGPVDTGELGLTTRALHAATRKTSLSGLPRLDPFAFWPWLDWPADWLSDGDRAALRRHADQLLRRWRKEAAGDPLGMVLVHGDLHGNNALKTADGIVLVDFEDAGVGPASYDLAPLATGVRRYGDSAAEFERFLAGFGHDPRQWPGFSLFCKIYELMVTVWSLRCEGVAPAMAAEAKLRIAGVLGNSDEQWTMR